MDKELMLRATVTFANLFIAGIGIIIGGYHFAPADVQQVLTSVGSAILGGGLAFYLVEMFAIERRG